MHCRRLGENRGVIHYAICPSEGLTATMSSSSGVVCRDNLCSSRLKPSTHLPLPTVSYALNIVMMMAKSLCGCECCALGTNIEDA